MSSDSHERDDHAAAASPNQSETYLRMILRAMSDIVLVIDVDGTYLDVAPTAPELRHGHSKLLVGRRVDELATPEDAAVFLAIIREVVRTGAPRLHNYSFPGPEGQQYFNATVSPLNDRSVLWVARDVTAQHQAEVEVSALREQIIEAQREALRELSTPLIPLADGLLAMPLIGTIDSNRAQQVIEALLTGVSAANARTVILDITGVSLVDTQVASALLRAAQAVKLLGAEVILTGIRPEVAQTLVTLGADLSGITTRATLQSGIASAMEPRGRG